MVHPTDNNGFNLSDDTDLYSVTRSGSNANWVKIDSMVAKNSYDQPADPGSSDDEESGYAPGSFWYTRDPANRLWQCISAVKDSAVWKLIFNNDTLPSLKDDWYAGNYQIRAKQFYADVPDAAPLIVTSSIKVDNLNADQLDGKHNTDFIQVGVAGNMGNVSFTAANFVSTTPNGTQPYACTSNEININLNADTVDGKHAAQLVWQSSAINTNDFLVASAPGTWTNKTLDATKELLGINEDSTAFWTLMPGNPSRVSDTQFTITDVDNANGYDLMFKMGTIIKWEKNGGGTQIAMIVDATPGTGIVTINIVGSTLAVEFIAGSMKYCIHRAIKDVFIVPGVMPSAATVDIAKTIYIDDPTYVIAGLVRYKTASLVTGGTWDVNDNGVSIFPTTKLLIGFGTLKGTLTGCSFCLPPAGAPPAPLDSDSNLTLDYDAGPATNSGSDAYVSIWYMPAAWRYIV